MNTHAKAKVKRQVKYGKGQPTPGTWDASHGPVWYRGKEFDAIDSGYIPIFSHLKDGSDLLICTVPITIPDRLAEYLANAQLIGAAPDLLAECSSLLAYLKEHNPGAATRVEAAIAKATGKQQASNEVSDEKSRANNSTATGGRRHRGHTGRA